MALLAARTLPLLLSFSKVYLAKRRGVAINGGEPNGKVKVF